MQSKIKTGGSSADDADRAMRKLFVDKLDSSITESDIYEVFSKHGEIEEVAKYQDKRDTRRYYAFVVYKHAADCVKATSDPCPVIKGRKCACILAAIGKAFSGYKYFVKKGLLTDEIKKDCGSLGSPNNSNNNNNHASSESGSGHHQYHHHQPQHQHHMQQSKSSSSSSSNGNKKKQRKNKSKGKHNNNKGNHSGRYQQSASQQQQQHQQHQQQPAHRIDMSMFRGAVPASHDESTPYSHSHHSTPYSHHSAICDRFEQSLSSPVVLGGSPSNSLRYFDSRSHQSQNSMLSLDGTNTQQHSGHPAPIMMPSYQHQSRSCQPTNNMRAQTNSYHNPIRREYAPLHQTQSNIDPRHSRSYQSMQSSRYHLSPTPLNYSSLVPYAPWPPYHLHPNQAAPRSNMCGQSPASMHSPSSHDSYPNVASPAYFPSRATNMQPARPAMMNASPVVNVGHCDHAVAVYPSLSYNSNGSHSRSRSPIMQQTGEFPQTMQTASFSHGVTRSSSTPSPINVQQPQSQHFPIVKPGQTFPMDQTPRISMSTSAVQLRSRAPANPPSMTHSRSANARHDNESLVEDITSPELLMMGVEIGLTPSPPTSPPPVPPLPLQCAERSSIDVEAELAHLDLNSSKLTRVPTYSSLEDAKKATDHELEAGFTMLGSPYASEEDNE